MSNQSFSQQNLPQSERLPNTIGSAHQLAQFTAAKTAGYQPKSQMSGSAPPPPPSPASNPTTQASSTSQPGHVMVAAYLKALDDQSSLTALSPQAIDVDKFKGFKFITLDGLVVATRDIYDKVSGTFKWEMCESQAEHCIQYIQNECADKRVFFISSGGLGKDIIPRIHDLPQVYCIYVYCGDLTLHVPWATKFSKVRVVCNDDDRYLVPQLAVDVAQANIDWGNALLAKGTRDKAKPKFEKAVTNLKEYAKKPNQAMVNEANTKLAQCQ